MNLNIDNFGQRYLLVFLENLELGGEPGNWEREREREGVASNFENIWNSKGHLSARVQNIHISASRFFTTFSVDGNAFNQK